MHKLVETVPKNIPYECQVTIRTNVRLHSVRMSGYIPYECFLTLQPTEKFRSLRRVEFPFRLSRTIPPEDMTSVPRITAMRGTLF